MKIATWIATKVSRKPLLSAVGILMLIGTALADIASDMTNFSTIITSFTGFFTNMMTVFMQPPLVYFVVLGVFVTFVHLVASFLIKRGKR